MTKKKAQKRNRRWVTRDNSRNSLIDVYSERVVKRPIMRDGWSWSFSEQDGEWFSVCPKEFKALFGFLPRRGTAVKVEFSGKVVK